MDQALQDPTRMLSSLTPAERLRLMKFVCAFAWADLKVQTQERAFVSELVLRLHLDAAEVAQVQRWLEVPPPVDQVDPTEIPFEHRRLFLQTVRQLSCADGQIDERERESIALLADLLEAHVS